MNAPLPAQVLATGDLRPMPEVMLETLRAQSGEPFSTANAVREQHGRDESTYPVTPPEAVVFCESTEDVAAAAAMTNKPTAEPYSLHDLTYDLTDADGAESYPIAAMSFGRMTTS